MPDVVYGDDISRGNVAQLNNVSKTFSFLS